MSRRSSAAACSAERWDRDGEQGGGHWQAVPVQHVPQRKQPRVIEVSTLRADPWRPGVQQVVGPDHEDHIPAGLNGAHGEPHGADADIGRHQALPSLRESPSTRRKLLSPRCEDRKSVQRVGEGIRHAFCLLTGGMW